MKVDSFEPYSLPPPHICSPYFVRLIFLDERILLPPTPPSPHNPSPPLLTSPFFLSLSSGRLYYAHTETNWVCQHMYTCTEYTYTWMPSYDYTDYIAEELSTTSSSQLHVSHTFQQDRLKHQCKRVWDSLPQGCGGQLVRHVKWTHTGQLQVYTAQQETRQERVVNPRSQKWVSGDSISQRVSMRLWLYTGKGWAFIERAVPVCITRPCISWWSTLQLYRHPHSSTVQ